jgi:hypothetical protein
MKIGETVQVLTKEQLANILKSHKQIQDCIDTTNYLRNTGKVQNINYFERFVTQTKKYI